MTPTTTTLLRTAALAALAVGATTQVGLAAASPPGDPSVYTQSNDASANAILAFDREGDGSLTPAGAFATGGLGTGAGLGSQGAVAIDDDTLLAVNAGSDDVSLFRVTRRGPRLADREPSRGDRPVSVTVHGGLVYVVNAGSSDVSGFRIGKGGDLVPIAGSTRALTTADAGPAQVEFSPDGGTVVVTEKNTNVIDSFPVRRDGRLDAPVVTPSRGQTPFGFAFDRRGRLVVSEAFGGAVGASAASSYAVLRGGALRNLSASVPTLQTAACWVAVTDSGRFAYAANTGSDSITGYAVSGSGALTRLTASGVTAATGDVATDLALTRASRYLYSRGAGDGSLTGFRVGDDGSLTRVGTTTGLPTSAVGLVAR